MGRADRSELTLLIVRPHLPQFTRNQSREMPPDFWKVGLGGTAKTDETPLKTSSGSTKRPCERAIAFWAGWAPSICALHRQLGVVFIVPILQQTAACGLQRIWVFNALVMSVLITLKCKSVVKQKFGVFLSGTSCT